MELLQGEDLATRLARFGMLPDESLDLIRRVADALAFAHDKGIIHRDIKPSNLFLVEGDVTRVKILDFGIARTTLSLHGLTQTGAMLGTVGYMAPEQAMGSSDVDARADVFALGCVLFETLTGRRAFTGDHAVAVLAKVLAEEAPRVSELRPGIGGAVDALVARMLAKNREDRPHDARAVFSNLEQVSVQELRGRPEAGRTPEGLTRSERRIVSVILGELTDADAGRTVTAQEADQMVRVEQLALKFGARPMPLPGGSLLLVLSSRGTASDQASRAASCALRLRRLEPRLRVVLATGWSETTGAFPVGPVVDRAAELLHSSRAEDAGHVITDDVTAGLLGSRFFMRKREDGFVLLGENDSEQPRLLLGRRTPCVGRDKELAFLQATLVDCIEDRATRAVLVTGAPGSGKSRLRQEFLQCVREEGAVRVVVAQADSMSAGSAFVLARQIVERVAGLTPSDPWDVQHRTLRERLLEWVEAEDAGVIAEFLCELLGAPVEDPSPILRSARSDPRLLADWLRSSFEDWLKVEAREPLLVVLEDLHWGDLPSVTYLGRVLRSRNLPLMVLALARPEVHESFPRLWEGRLHEVSLAGLGRRAAEQLVRAVLSDLSASTLTRIVALADGNAFYLEELIRAVAEGRGDALPETVIAMAHARLERLDSGARRLLRAASVLGERFWLSGVSAILGSEADLLSRLALLEELEVVARSRSGRFPGERQYVFRHALVRDAAYATLTQDDRKTAHRLAAEWLERVGETDPVVMADHLDNGGEPDRAVPWILRAAEAAYDGGSAAAGKSLAERGLALAEGEELGMLKTIIGVCDAGQGEFEKATVALRDAMSLLPKGGRRWFVASTNRAFFGAIAGNASATAELAEAIAGLPVVTTSGGLYAWSAARVVLGLMLTGQPQTAKSFLDRLEVAAASEAMKEASFVSWLALARVYTTLWSKERELAALARNVRLAVTTFEQVRDPLGGSDARFWEAMVLLMLGRYGEIQETVEHGLVRAEESGYPAATPFLELALWAGATQAGRCAEALEPLARLAGTTYPYPIVTVSSAVWLARALALDGDTTRAEATVREALEKSRGMAVVEASAHAALAQILLSLGRPEESLVAAERATEFPVEYPVFFDELPLTRAEALAALDRSEEARVAIGEARDRVLWNASTLEDEDRASYLTNVNANVRTLTLANEWLGNAKSRRT